MIEALIVFVIYLIVIGLIAWLLLYLVDRIPLASPFREIARVAIMVISVLIVVLLLLGLIGAVEMPRLRRL